VLKSIKTPYRRGLPNETVMELQLLTPPPLRPVGTVKIIRGVFGDNVTDADIVRGMLIVSRKSDRLDVYDLDEVVGDCRCFEHAPPANVYESVMLGAKEADREVDVESVEDEEAKAGADASFGPRVLTSISSRENFLILSSFHPPTCIRQRSQMTCQVSEREQALLSTFLP